MSDFIKFRRGECPICKGAEKRCNYIETENEYGFTSKLIFCKGTTNDPNYIFRGTAQQTGFGMWAYLPDVEAWKDSKKNKLSQEKYLQEKEARKQQEENKRREKISKSLSLSVRDREIRKLISQLELSQYHKNQLLARGLTAAQIEKNGYRSVKQWQKLSIPVDKRLAGVSINGNKLNNPDSGILCPVLNGDGLFVGLRINNDNPEIKELGKYTWLSSSGRGIDNKIPVSELDEEFLLAVHYPKRWTDFTRIGICEGLEYKSPLAADYLGYPVIGFSGNDFTSSPNLIEQAIEAIKRKLWSRQQSQDLCNNPKGQSQTRQLSDDLSSLQKSHNQNRFPQPNSNQKSEKVLKTLKSLSPTEEKPTPTKLIKIVLIPDSGINLQVASSYLKAIDHYQNHYLEIAYWGHFYDKGQDIDEISTGTQIQYLNPEEAQKLLQPLTDPGFHQWLKHRKFTADEQFNVQWLTQQGLDAPQPNTITFIKSGLGTGKTTLLKKWLKEDLTNQGAFSLGCRNTLLHQFCESAGFYHIHEHNFGDMRHDPNGQFALCVDSLLKFKPEDFDDKVIILDEVRSILPHLLTSATIPKHLRNHIINLFKEAIRRASRVICLDGNLCDWVVEFLQQTAPDKTIVRLENVFRKARQLISYRGSITKKGKINNRDRTGLIAKMLTATRPAIVADSQKHCEELDELLSQYGYNVLRIDSSTSGEDYTKEFLANPDAYLEKYQPDALILSPSAESGIDISIKGFFSDLFILAFGTLGVDQIRQMSQRVRDEIPTHLWVNESPKVKKQISQGYQEIIDDIIKYSEETTFALVNKEELLQRISDSIDRNQNRIETITAETLQEIEAYEKSHYRQCMLFAFEQAGYIIEHKIGHSDPAVKKELKEIRENIHRERAQQIFHAPDLNEQQLEKAGITQNEKYSRIKASLKKQLPGVENTWIWNEEFIYDVIFKHPNYLRCIDNNFLFHNPLIADALKDKQLRYLTTNLLRNHDVSLWEFSRRYEQIQGLREVGLERILDAPEGTQFTYNDEIIQDIYSKLRRRPKLRAQLGIEKVGKYAMREVNRLLRTIGRKFQSGWVRSGDSKYRVYTLCRENTNLLYKNICYELTQVKWTNWVQKEILNLSQAIEESPENLSLDKIAKLFALHSLKLATHTHNKLHNNQALSGTKQQNEPRLLETLKKLKRKIAQKGISRREGDREFRAYIERNPLEIAQDLADFIEVDWQIFIDFLNSVGDSIKFQLFGLLQGFVTG